MSRENVDAARRGYASYNEAMSAPDPLAAIREWLDRFAHPEVEWKPDAGATSGRSTFRGVEEVIGVYEMLLDSFGEVHETPEEFIESGDHVVVFVRTEIRGRASQIAIEEHPAHLLTYRDGVVIRFEVFRDRNDALRAAGLAETARG